MSCGQMTMSQKTGLTGGLFLFKNTHTLIVLHIVKDEVVVERGQTNRSSGGQRPSLLDRRGHEEAGRPRGQRGRQRRRRPFYYCGRVHH